MYNDYLNANPEFEVLGYSKDIWFDGKYYGSIRMDEKDREQIGYHGRRFETLESNLKIKNKRIIKAGSEVMTEIFPINGKLINKQ